MTTQALVEKLNKEVKTLRRDVSEIKTVLLKALSLREENLKDYHNAAFIKKALQKALRTYPRT
jgi:hypothetical protein